LRRGGVGTNFPHNHNISRERRNSTATAAESATYSSAESAAATPATSTPTPSTPSTASASTAGACADGDARG
jgi:hypothetical protein